MFGFDVFAVAFVVLGVILVAKGVNSVPQGQAWTVERFGKYTQTLNPGLHIIIPFIDDVGRKQIVMEQVLDVPPQEVISADNAMVTTDAVCFFQIVDPVAASYEVNDLERAMRNLVMTNIRAVLGSLELDAMLSNRDEINFSLLKKVDEATNPWGVKVTRIEIKDITPPRDLVEAMANQMKAEREKRSTVLIADGERQAAIMVAEGEKKGQILKAEGQREAAFLESEAREREAQAEAKATYMVSEAIAKGNPQAINYFIAQKYTEALATIGSAENSKVIMIPLEASSLLGSIEGIKDLLGSAKS
jgi:regulator of protease activity HflC (stomatin/prohibitin superfamily)